LSSPSEHPDDFDTLLRLGVRARDARQFDEAAECYRRAQTIQPNSPLLFIHLGDLAMARGAPRVAVAHYGSAARLDPQAAMPESRRATALQASGELQEAVAHYRRAIALSPRDKMAHYNLGTALESLGERDLAADQFRAALALDPGFAIAHLNLGAYYQRLRDFAPAQAHYDSALAIDPDSAMAHFNRGLIWLTEGQWEDGWREYEWRAKVPNFPIRSFPYERWQGAPLAGTLLVHSEQGLGDTLQFIRYVPLVRPRCARVLTLVQPGLAQVLEQSGFGDVFEDERDLPHAVAHVPLLSLPGIVGTTVENVPAPKAYLSADPRLVEVWRQRLGQSPALRVGLCWQGSAKLVGDARRSIPLAAFAPLARVPGIQLVSLQRHEGVEQLDALAGQFSIVDLRPDYDTEAGAFTNAAAVMRCLDLVISVDTAIAHLAGALGVPVWVALPARSDWRWLLSRDDSPWYPTMRLFRQAVPDEWTDVVEHMAAALAALH
jgi:tetratricopeptide (TPR) repeat protein